MPSTVSIDRSGVSRGRARRLASLAAAGAILLAGGGLAAAGPASADSVINPSSNAAVYTLQNQATGQVADDLNASTDAGNTIGQWPSKGGTNQQWTIVSSSGSDAGYYTIQNDESGMCLDVSGQSTADGAPVIQWPCNGQDNQEWQINYTGSWNGAAPIATIVNKNSGKDLNVVGTNDGTGLIQGGPVSSSGEYQNLGYSNQWSLTRSTGGIPFVMSATSPHTTQFTTSDGYEVGWPALNEIVEVPNSTTAWGTPVDLQPATGKDNQEWYLQAAGTIGMGESGTYTEYRVINANSGDCLEAEGANPQDGAVVDQYGCDVNSVNQPNQLWIIPDPWDASNISIPFTSYSAVDFYNVATAQRYQDGSFDYPDSPVLTESSTIYPATGSTMTIMSYNARSSAALYITNTVWNLQAIGGSGGTSNSGPPACTMFACLLGDG
jgi:Ricin-type beta-trefoil lectin domain-like